SNDLPLKGHARIRLDSCPYGLAQPLDVFRGRLPLVDEEIAVHLGNLRAADAQAAAAGRVDELPGAVTRRILEGGSASSLARRLVLLAVLGNLFHLLEDVLRLARPALIGGFRKNPVPRHAAMAVA